MPTVLARPSTGTTESAGTSGTTVRSTAITRSQPADMATAAIRFRPSASSTLNRHAVSP